MNRFFKWLTVSGSSTVSPETKNYPASVIAMQTGGVANWSASTPQLLAQIGYLKNPVVYRCVRMISEAVSSIEWNLFLEADELDQHPLLELLERPNSNTTKADFVERMCGQLLLHGNAYAKTACIDGEPRELHLLNPQTVTAKSDEFGNLKGYQHQVGSRKHFYSQDGQLQQVLHLSLFNPIDDVVGYAPLGAAHMAMDMHNSACRWNKALLDNSARPSGALVYSSKEGGNLSDDQFSRLKSELEEGYTGPGRAGRPLVLEGGLDWKAMGFSPKDMDFNEAKNSASRDIALAFGIPPMLIGIPGDNTYSNYREANRAFWLQSAIPIASRICASFSTWLAPMYGEHLKLKPDMDSIDALSSDREAQWSKVQSADFLTVNEKRAAVGYGPIEMVDGGR